MAKIIVLKDGTELVVIKEDKKYLYCEGTQFRPNHPSIKEIRKATDKERFENLPDLNEEEKEIENDIESQKEKPVEKKKATAKKSDKKGE